MPDRFDKEAVYQGMLELYNSIPPGPDHTERFLEKLHGPGWKERAMMAGPLTLEFSRRLRELEARVSRIERHLNRPSGPLDPPKLGPTELLKPEPQGE